MVVLGDFNSEEQDSPCWLLRRGRLERNHTDACCPQVGGVRWLVLYLSSFCSWYRSAAGVAFSAADCLLPVALGHSQRPCVLLTG